MGEVEVKLDKIKVNISALGKCAKLLEGQKNELEKVSSDSSLSGPSAELIQKSLQQASSGIESVKSQTNGLKDALSDIYDQYQTTEKEVVGKGISRVTYSFHDGNAYAGVSADYEDGNIHLGADAGASYALWGASVSNAGRFGETNASMSLLSAMGEAGAYVDVGDGKIDIGANANVSGAVLKGNASISGRYGEASADAELFAAAASVGAGATLQFQNGRLTGNAEVSASASAQVAHGSARGKAGNDSFNVHGNAEGSVLGAGANANAGVSLNADGSVTASAGAGAEAFLAKGEVSAGFTFFGIKVDIGAEGGIGVQAKAEGEVSTSGVGLNLGLGPVGGKVKIDWSDFGAGFWK